MSGSIDIGFGGSGGGAAAGGASTFSTITVGTSSEAPFATTGDIRLGSSFAINSSSANISVASANGNGYIYYGGGSAQGIVFSAASGALNFYGAALTTNANIAFGGQFQPTTQTVQTTSPAAGGAGALPATPKGYWSIQLNGSVQLVPYY